MKVIETLFVAISLLVITLLTLALIGCSPANKAEVAASPAATTTTLPAPALQSVCTSPAVSLICVNGMMFGLIQGVFQAVPQGYSSIKGTWASECDFTVVDCTWTLEGGTK